MKGRRSFGFVEILAPWFSTEAVEKLWIAPHAHRATRSHYEGLCVLHNSAASTEMRLLWTSVTRTGLLNFPEHPTN